MPERILTDNYPRIHSTDDPMLNYSHNAGRMTAQDPAVYEEILRLIGD